MGLLKVWLAGIVVALAFALPAAAQIEFAVTDAANGTYVSQTFVTTAPVLYMEGVVTTGNCTVSIETFYRDGAAWAEYHALGVATSAAAVFDMLVGDAPPAAVTTWLTKAPIQLFVPRQFRVKLILGLAGPATCTFRATEFNRG